MPDDEHIVNGRTVFDDDRLLAYALGLSDDPELAVATAADPALRQRLELIRVDLGQIEQQLDLAVPLPDDEWAGLSSDRWDQLRPYLTAPQAARRRRFTWRVLAPLVTVAAAIALAVGITISGHLGSRDAESTGDRNVLSTGGEAASPESDSVQEAGELAAGYQVIAVARASAADGALQKFTVLRTLKGRLETNDLTLTAGPAGAVPEGRLAMLFLQRQSDKAGVSASPATAQDEDSATTGEDEAGRLLFSLADGTTAPVLVLPEGTLPGDVTLP